jgi:chromosome segregation ATPase
MDAWMLIACLSLVFAQDEYDQKWASLSARLEFEYDAASVRRGKADFRPEDVKGVVARLVTVDDTRATTALEAVAGGKLYSVVVDTADTGERRRRVHTHTHAHTDTDTPPCLLAPCQSPHPVTRCQSRRGHQARRC